MYFRRKMRAESKPHGNQSIS